MVDQSVEGVPASNRGQDARDTGNPVPPVVKKRLSRSRRQMYLQIVAATVILACGIIIGAGAALLHFKEDIVPDRFPPPVRIANDMQERYGLTEGQTEKVKAVVAASSERMHTIFTGIREKMDAEFQELSAAMKDILTAEQFKRWERDFTSRRGRRPGRFGPGGPGPGGHRPPSRRGGPGGGRGGSGRTDPNGRPGGWPGGPGGGRSGPGRTDPNGKPRQDRRGYPGFRTGQRGPAEPNSQVD